MAKKSNRRAAGPEIVDAEQQLDLSQVVEGEQVPIADEWVPEFMNPNTPFFDAVAGIPDGGWEKTTIYLYRLEPAVANKSGEKKYIGVFGTPITEATVQREHGGGKYEAWVKYGVGKQTTTLRHHRFWIDGDPIYKEGQTLRGGPAAGAPVIPPAQDIGGIVRQVIEATGGNSKAAEAGVDVMKRAMMDGMELNKTIVTSQLNSTTGSALGDKLFELLLPRLFSAPQTDPIVMKLVEAAISNMKAERKEPNPPPAAPATDQLGLVKELLGVDSLREIIDLGRGGREQPWWVGMLSNAIEKLPTLFSEYAQMQERAFQRAIIAHQLSAGQVLPPGQTPALVRASAAPIIHPPAAPSGTQPANGNMSEQMVQAIVQAICQVYDEGYPGEMAAVHIKLLYPQLAQSLAPLLGNEAQLQSFVAAMPALAERAVDQDWPEFQKQFIAEISQVPAQVSIADDAAGRTIDATGGASASAGDGSRKGPAPAKKKANGSAA